MILVPSGLKYASAFSPPKVSWRMSLRCFSPSYVFSYGLPAPMTKGFGTGGGALTPRVLSVARNVVRTPARITITSTVSPGL